MAGMRDIFINDRKERSESPSQEAAVRVSSKENPSIADRIFLLLGPLYIRITSFFKSKRQTTRGKASIVLSAAFLLAAGIFVFAELGGYGVNGPATAPNSLDYGLVGYWDMEEGSGQTVYDKSGNGNNGVLGVNSSIGTDDPVFASGHNSSGQNGLGLQFDGINDYVQLPSSVPGNYLSLGQDYSIGFWVNANDLVSVQEVLTYSASASNRGGVRIRSNTIGAGTYDGASSVYVSGTITNGWHYITVIHNASNTMSMYIDGILQTGTMSNSFWSSNSFTIGGAAGGVSLNGSIDEVRAYKRVLSADEVRLLYNQKKPILQYGFDEGSGTVLYDGSFNNNDATLVNTPAYVAGKSATALDFASTSFQYGYLADNASVSLTKDLALSVWIKPESVTAATQFDIVGKWDGANESYLLSQYGDEIRVYIDSSSSYKTTDAANLSAGSWYHIEAVYSASSQTVNIYVNGMLQSGTVTGTIPASIGDDAGRFQVGAEDSTTTAANFYDGIIDSLRIYNYVRTQDEVLTDYNDGLAAKLGGGTRSWYGEDGGSAWGYRKSITINHLQVSNTDQANFPVLVSFIDANLKEVAGGGRVESSEGYDIAFTASDGVTLLDFEIEKYVPSTGELEAWVKIPNLSAAADVPIYMYYGSGQTSSLEDVSGVWDDGGSGHFASVWHLGESPAATAGDFDDATANDNDSVNTTNQPDAAAGKIDGALDFNGADDYLEFSDSQELRMNTGGTISAWINLTSIGEGSAGRIIDKSTGTSAESGYMLAVVSSQVVDFEVNGGADTLSSLNAITLGQSQLVTVTFDGSGRKIYVNGTDVTSSNGSLTALPPDTAGSVSVGNRAGNTDRALDGIVDEVRLSNVVRSADWIKTEFNNQNTPSSFYSVGSEEEKPIMILEYRFDEGTGTVVHDESFNDNDGLLGGDGLGTDLPSWVTGKNSSALSFDGTDDYVDISSALPVHSLTSYSISLWVKGAPGQLDKRLFSQGSSTNSYPMLTIGTDSAGASGKLDIYIRNESNVVFLNHFQSQSTVFDNTWHHIEWTDTAGSVKIFVDGVLDNSSSYTPLASVLPCDRAALGAVTRSALSHFFAGFVDDVRIYNYARTAEEVSVDYNNGQAAHLGQGNQYLNHGLVGYWDMEEGSGQTVYDKSGNGNDGVLGDTTAAESNDPVFGPGHNATGENGSGMVYDGYDDYANAGTGSSLNVTGAITMSAWVKPAVSDGSIIRKVDANLGYMMHLMSDQRVQIGINEFNSPLTTANNVITLNSWNHIVAAVDGSGAAVIYVNGLSVATGSLQALNTTATNPLLIGGDSWNSGNYFNGSIDEVRVYNRAISADEVRYLYNQKKPVLQYNFDKGSGTVAHDESFNDYDATISSSGVGWTVGKYGTALSFDGTYNGTTAYPNLKADEITISFFMKDLGTSTAWTAYVNLYTDENNRISIETNEDATRVIPVVRIGGVGYDAPDVPRPVGFNFYSVVFSKSGNFRKTYVNGVLADTFTDYPGGLTTDALYLGYSTVSIIDNFRIYNYARTADEILNDYNDSLAAHLR